MRDDVATRFAFDRRVRALEAAVVGVAGSTA
jgi:hypothetical protein